MAMTFTTPIVGKNTFIHPTALIGNNVTIGDNCYIGPYCIIGYPAEWKGYENSDIGVYIGHDTRLTGAVTIDSGVNKITTIGRNCYFMKGSHVGHDATINESVTLSCGAKIGGHAIVDSFVTIGLNAVIHQRCVIPTGCMIGALAFIGKKTILKEYRKYAGVPAKDIGPNHPL